MKLAYLLIGIMATGLGAIGVVLPVLPTTPFLLLAAYCFAKSSKRFHTWLMQTSMYQNHLASFVEQRSMRLRTKVSLFSFASAMLLLAMYFTEHLYLRLFLLCLMAFKYYYFLCRIETIRS